ncbi:helix-turn-helix transcriptional regulator [Bacillus paramycoides]|uniref:helix-turn-helix transcriptional regulator n=1 Tax=Bacillus paramycoides TaxID=2026194 RepID=UPI003CFBF5A1
MAQKLNISRNQMSNYLTGKSHPTVDKGFELAKIFGWKIDDLYELKVPPLLLMNSKKKRRGINLFILHYQN